MNITYKLYIKNNIDITELRKKYSACIRYCYKRLLNKDLLDNKIIRNRFNLDSQITRDVKSEVEALIIKENVVKLKFKNLLSKAYKELDLTIDSRKKFKLIIKIKHLLRSIKSKVVFGGYNNLKNITRYSNENNKELVNKYKKLYQEKRLLPFYSSGDAFCRHGSRKFKLDIENNKLIFEPFRNKDKYAIEVKFSKKQKEILLKIQNLENNIPITYRLTNQFIFISFDTDKLNNIYVNYKSLSIQAKKLGIDKQILFSKERQKIKNLKLKGKIKDRYAAVDLNPERVGLSIVDKQNFRIVKTFHFEFNRLSKKLRLSSTDKKQLYQNNKRKYEISIIWKYIFSILKHYKVQYFVMEELNFKDKLINENSKKSNYKTKNIWHRTLTTNLIKKHCSNNLIDLIEINPAYTSFIGNIKYDYSDPINASLMVCYRAINKFKKGKFFPELSKVDQNTMSDLLKDKLRDDFDKNVFKSWKEWFIFFKQTGERYRQPIENFLNRFSLKSYKSGVFIYEY